MNNNYYDSNNYNVNKHWHIEYYKVDNAIEGICFQRKEDRTWDVFFNDFINESEYIILFEGTLHYKDQDFGVFLFNAGEDKVIEKFHEWVKNVLLPIRELKN
jgi:Uri superfamily endonuclease